MRLGGTGERSLVRRLRPSRGRPSPSSRCACLPAPTPPPGHTHPERPQHLHGQQVQGRRGRGPGPVPRALGLGLTRTACGHLGTRDCHEVTCLPLGCPATEGTEPLLWQVPWLSAACPPRWPFPTVTGVTQGALGVPIASVPRVSLQGASCASHLQTGPSFWRG